jgi:hypothetical protein
MKSFRITLAAALAFVAVPALADRVTPDYAKQNLDLIPATDPDAPDAPKLLSAVKGQHPRLLYTQGDIDALKQRIATDPILKATYDQNLALYKRFALPAHTPEHPLSLVYDDTSALSVSMERYAGLAYFYSLDKDPKIKQDIIDILTMMLNEPYWADTAELDSSMGGAVNMLMVAVLYDAVYNDLDPDFRAKMDAKILIQARRLYYLGFMQKSLLANKYWQQDPQPNHRWYRIAGEMGSLLVLNGEPNINTDYLLREMKKEMDFVMKSYPPDGDCHEGAGYQQFGFASILRAALMMDRDLGTTYLKDTGLKNAWMQQIYYNAPSGGSQMSFGDDMNTPGIFTKLDAAFFACMTYNQDKNAQAMFKHYYESKNFFPPELKRQWTNPWDMLEFYDPSVGEGDYHVLPTNHLFADLGAASLRDSWDPTATAFTFKCAPYGGYKLNEYRQAYADKYGNPHYVNVAHDDPDANSFSMTIGSDFMFHPGLYSLHKITENQSTITVDGKGQINEGTDFMQPVDGVDMRTLCGLTGWKQDDKGRAIIEGEAARSYIGMDFKELYAWQYPETVPDPLPPGSPPGTPPPPLKPRNPVTGLIKQPPPSVLKRYRRTAIWMPGEYVLLLDDIRGNGKHDIMWHGTVEKGKIVDAAKGLCQAYAKDGTSCDFQILADKDFNGALDFEFLDGRFGSYLAQQFQFSLNTDAVKFACLFDPWKKKPTLTLKENGDTVTLTVKSDSFDDTWTWTGAKDDNTPSVINGTRAGAPLISLAETDKAPKE